MIYGDLSYFHYNSRQPLLELECPYTSLGKSNASLFKNIISFDKLFSIMLCSFQILKLNVRINKYINAHHPNLTAYPTFYHS